jgi:hypothetical protein
MRSWHSLGGGVLLLCSACGGDKANATAAENSAPGVDAGKAPGSCNLHTDFPGDDTCLPRPDPSEGIQIHVGPSDYTDPADVNRFVMQPGDESSECWSFHTPNAEDFYYQSFELRGRPGTHHIIDTMYKTELTDGGFTLCRDGGVGVSPDILSNLPGASKPYIARQPVAPENAHIANLIPPHTPTQADMHYFNLTGAPILREFWLNIYSVPKAQVTAASLQIRGMGGLSWTRTPIPPLTHNVYQYSCPISADGRVTELLGHTHAHGIRETAWIRDPTTSARVKVFEQFDYKEPQIFYYDTVAKNPAFTANRPGAFTGVLDVKAGDALDWECEVNNDSDKSLTYTNEVQTGEMCNIWGQTVGPLINCVLQ